MKKLILVLMFVMILTACGSKEVVIPVDSKQAVCTQGDVFKYIYKDSTVYRFYSNDVLQDSAMLNIVQTAADDYSNFEAYLDVTFATDACVITDYSEE